jgi:hypothetical protein
MAFATGTPPLQSYYPAKATTIAVHVVLSGYYTFNK